MRKRDNFRQRRIRSSRPALLLLLILLHPLICSAYAGPGAGFAVLSSFWTLLLAFSYSMYALVSWPFRVASRWWRHRKAYANAQITRAIVIGFDGMDPDLTERLIAEGRMPNLAQLRKKGTGTKLRTTFPAISPVAWSSFMTGVNPGKHNIYDFLACDRDNYLPILSSAEIRGPKRTIKIGNYNVPIGKPRIRSMRHGTPFWHLLGDAGIFCSVIRVPVTFPPEKFDGVLLSGMCVPDLKGSQGTFCLCTTRPEEIEYREGGVRVPIEQDGALFRSYVPGPDNPLQEGPPLRVSYEIRLDKRKERAEFRMAGERFALKVGEYSQWIPLKFKSKLGFSARGICRFYLKELAPELEVYITPINIDPSRPDLPISYPNTYSIYLAKLFGPYATLGLAEDTWALNEEVLDDDAFLAQCYANFEDRERMFFDALEKTQKGLCTCVFDATDRIQHMFWRYLENDHPSSKGILKENRPPVIQELYSRVDRLIGRVMEELDEKTLFMVISDHGFKSFARCINVNAWLHDNGYLNLKPGKIESGDWFEHVDWSSTRVYTMGLNGLFLNLKGRERFGVVEPGREASQLKDELRCKLSGLVDPDSGRIGITGMFDCDQTYAGPYVDEAPDLLIGYGEGFRASWDSVMGKVTRTIFEDNVKAWSGDHCIDPRLVPGVLFANRKIEATDPSIVDVAPTLLKLFGIEPPKHLDGKPWHVKV